MSQTIDIIYTYRFLKILTTPWDEMDAFKEGIIDEKGRQLKKLRELNTMDEKDAYTYFHRMVFNLKRLLNKLPGGESKIASYASALFLIKEDKNITPLEAYDYLIEEVVTANSVGSGNIDFTPAKKKKKVQKRDTYKEFSVPSEVFRKFDTGRNKFERWSKYLNLQDENQHELYTYAKRNPKNTVILRDATTGAVRSIRRRSSNGHQKITLDITSTLQYNIHMKKYKEQKDEWGLEDTNFKPKRKNKNSQKIKRTKPRKSKSWEQ